MLQAIKGLETDVEDKLKRMKVELKTSLEDKFKRLEDKLETCKSQCSTYLFVMTYFIRLRSCRGVPFTNLCIWQ